MYLKKIEQKKHIKKLIIVTAPHKANFDQKSLHKLNVSDCRVLALLRIETKKMEKFDSAEYAEKKAEIIEATKGKNTIKYSILTFQRTNLLNIN